MGGDSEWISRAIVGFGRYAHNRPPGLRVDASGAMTLADLMRFWGRKESLTEDAILSAVRLHMFHEGDSGALRFAIGERDDGGIWVRVLPKRGAGAQYHRPCATPARAQRPAQEQGQWVRQKGQTVPPRYAKASEDDRSLKERLDMSLDDVVKGGRERKDKLAMPLDEVIREDIEMTDANRTQQAGDRRNPWARPGGVKSDGGGGWEGWSWGGGSWGSGRWGGASWSSSGGSWRDDAASEISKSPSRSRSPPRAPRPGGVAGGPEGQQPRAAIPARARKVPPRPPGAHWTKYQDEGKIWWHYQGPLGQWFCSGALEEPTPYEADA